MAALVIAHMAGLLALQGVLQALRRLGFLALGVGVVIVHLRMIVPMFMAVIVTMGVVMIVRVIMAVAIVMAMGMGVGGMRMTGRLAGRLLVIGIVCHGASIANRRRRERCPRPGRPGRDSPQYDRCGIGAGRRLR